MVKKRLIHVVASTGVSGVTAVIRFLSLGMMERGWVVYFVHYGNNDGFCEALANQGVHVVNIKPLPRFIQPLRTYWLIRNMKNILAGISPSIIHAHSFDADLISARAALGHQIPLLVTCHSRSYVGWVKEHIRQYEQLDRYIGRYVCVSNLLQKELSAVHTLSRDRIQTIYNAPDISFFEPVTLIEREKSRGKLGILSDELVITCVANYHPVKGQEVLAEAFARLTKNHNNRLILVGSENHRYNGDSIKQKVIDILEKAGFMNRCLMIEDCHDVRSFLAASDIYVQPSHQEGLSVALGEAFACGLPAVVTSAGGNPEMVSVGQNGFVVSPAHPGEMAAAIEALAENKDTRKNMGAQSLQFAKKYLHPDVILKAYGELYDELSKKAENKIDENPLFRPS
ncbi:MAG: glycosyltransferase family 4 protein [Syntrophales bacterium]